MNKKSIIYVTGHTGLVGSNLIQRLKKEGYINIVCLESKKLDLRCKEEVFNIFNKVKPEYVFNCAGKVGGIGANINNQIDFFLENIRIQNNVIESCLRTNVKKCIILGSSCVFPKDYKQPLKEEYLMNGPLEPTNEAYALAKICGLKLAEYANALGKTKFISLMPCNLYGAEEKVDEKKSHVLISLIKKVCDAKKNNKDHIVVWGNGKAKREFLYVEDLVDCMLWSIENLESLSSFYNVGTGEDISIRRLAKLIMKVVDYPCKIVYDRNKPNGMMRKCLDVSKLKNLGWKAKTSLEEGIKKTVQYYDQISK